MTKWISARPIRTLCRRKTFTFAISSSDEFLSTVSYPFCLSCYQYYYYLCESVLIMFQRLMTRCSKSRSVFAAVRPRVMTSNTPLELLVSSPLVDTDASEATRLTDYTDSWWVVCYIHLTQRGRGEAWMGGPVPSLLNQMSLNSSGWLQCKGKWCFTAKGAYAECSSPILRTWVRRWISHWVCDAWPVRRQTYGYLPSRRASSSSGRYQFILLADRDT